ncbi:restriction endonuclease subunit S [Enterobacter hormaechei]|uniref:restriction endonuclease subunit S n=1 Tax=Enterobacter hormaechei TaxID=158836 RepID=UPI00331459E1
MSELNYLEKLLDGAEVQWRTLDGVGQFLRGKRFVKSDLISEGVPCIHYGEMYTHYGISAEETKSFLDEGVAEKLRVANHGDVIIVAAGETIEDIGNGTAWLGKNDVVFHDACFSFKSELNSKYVSYFLRTKLFKEQIKRGVSSGKISSINAKGLGRAEIPIPCPDNLEKSLAIQSEIVRILDKFSALTAELTAELTVRKKQYAYYRDQLLSFDEGEIEWKMLEEVSDIYDSLHQTPQYAENGLSMIRVTDIKNGYVDLSKTLKVNNEVFATFTKKYSPQKNDLVMSRVGSYGNVGIIPLDNSACMGQNTVVIHPRINSSYLFYILSSNIGQNFIERNVGGGSQKTLSLKSIKAIPIPLVSEKEQFRIASILSKFDTLTNSISEGLPREIELRQKQYEYYRDLLFTFPKLNVQVEV